MNLNRWMSPSRYSSAMAVAAMRTVRAHDDRLDAFANKFAGSLSDRLLPLLVHYDTFHCLNHGCRGSVG